MVRTWRESQLEYLRYSTKDRQLTNIFVGFSEEQYTGAIFHWKNIELSTAERPQR